MLIGIEAERANLRQKTGVEHYAKQLILHLAQLDSENQYLLYLRTRPEEWFFSLPKNFTLKVMPFPIFWTQLRISWEMLWHPVDVLFIPASGLPLIHPKKSVVTIHDLAWIFYPQTFTWFNRHFLDWSTKFALRSASSVIAVSEATKKDLIQFYKTPEQKIFVVHHGYEVSVEFETHNNLKPGVLPQKYVLFLATLQPRKNLEGLIEAFRRLKSENPELPHKLVVVGKAGWKFEPILKLISQNSDTVLYLNHVPESDKAYILTHADLLVLPSFYEGFGMQILEAFAAGVPVAASNVSSMPEVAGEAAVYFDPKNINDIKNSIKNVVADKALAERLRQNGFTRLKSFSWQQCAKETLAVLQK